MAETLSPGMFQLRAGHGSLQPDASQKDIPQAEKIIEGWQRSPMYRNKNKNARRYQLRTFECSVCGERAPALKSLGRTNPGHIKHMYCIRCREITEHRQTE